MWLKVVAAVATRPHLWSTAVIQLFRLSPTGWWRRPPFLPVPPADYTEFRLVTQYGGSHRGSRPDATAHDVVEYLRWCRRWNRRS